MTTLPHHRGRGRPLTLGALASTAALFLAACTSSGSTDEDGGSDAGAPPPEPAWGEWQELDGDWQAIASSTDKALLSSGDETAVFDSTGQRLWDLPEDPDGLDQEPIKVEMDDNAVYVMYTEGNPLLALDADTGEQLWRFNPSDLDNCTPAKGVHFDVDPRSPELLVVSYTDDGVNPEDFHPGFCSSDIPTDSPFASHVVSLDRATGKQLYEPIKDQIGKTAVAGAFDFTGQYYDRVFYERLGTTITRTDVQTGETRSVDAYLSQGAAATNFGDGGDGTFTIATGGDSFEQVRVDRWADYWQEGDTHDYDEGEATAVVAPHDPLCSYNRTTSPSGYTYCNPTERLSDEDVMPVSQLLGDPSGEEIFTWTPDGSDPDTWEITGWDAARSAGTQPGGEADALLDPVVPASESAPALLVLPTEHDGLTAFDLRTGETVWESAPDTENPPSTAHYVPATDEILVSSPGNLKALDARSGEEAWEETDIDHDALNLSASGPAATVQRPGTNATTWLRFVEPIGS